MTPNSVNIKRPLIDGFTTIISRTSPRLRVLVFGGLLAIAGVALLLITPSATSSPERAWSLPFFGLVIAFGLAEATALHVEIRKESHSLSLSGIPDDVRTAPMDAPLGSSTADGPHHRPDRRIGGGINSRVAHSRGTRRPVTMKLRAGAGRSRLSRSGPRRPSSATIDV